MGHLRHISLGIAVAFCAVAILIGPAAALAADDPPPPAALAPAAGPDDAPVSLPPSAAEERKTARTIVAARDTTRPLTRAAARAHIERMSPRDWLANYGRVVVGRPD